MTFLLIITEYFFKLYTWKLCLKHWWTWLSSLNIVNCSQFFVTWLDCCGSPVTQSSSRVTWVTGDPKQLKYAIVCDGSHQVYCNYILYVILAQQLFYGMYLLILANYYHHHHHHLFLKRSFLPRSGRVRHFSRYATSPHTPEHCSFRV